MLDGAAAVDGAFVVRKEKHTLSPGLSPALWSALDVMIELISLSQPGLKVNTLIKTERDQKPTVLLMEISIQEQAWGDFRGQAAISFCLTVTKQRKDFSHTLYFRLFLKYGGILSLSVAVIV